MNPNYSEFKFPPIKQHSWQKVFRSKTPTDAIDLISRLLVYSPEKRLKPFEALGHKFFDDLRDQNVKLPNGEKLPDLFDFLTEEITSTTPEFMNTLIPEWYVKKEVIKDD